MWRPGDCISSQGPVHGGWGGGGVGGGQGAALAVRGQHMWRPVHGGGPGGCISSQGPVHGGGGGGPGGCISSQGPAHGGWGVGVGFHGAALADRDQHSL